VRVDWGMMVETVADVVGWVGGGGMTWCDGGVWLQFRSANGS
jgi:hypothetical protein